MALLDYQPPEPPWVLGSWARGAWARDSWGTHDEEDTGGGGLPAASGLQVVDLLRMKRKRQQA